MSTSPPPQRIYLVFSLAITPQTVQKLLIECVNWTNQGAEEIYLLFGSIGGNIAAGIIAYNVLRSLPVKLTTHNIGNVDSTANIIFLAGHERVAVPHATFMFHGAAFELEGKIKADQPYLTDKMETIGADHRKMASIISERAKFENPEEVLALFTSQATKDVDYALTHGLIHKIEHPQIPVGSRTLVFSD